MMRSVTTLILAMAFSIGSLATGLRTTVAAEPDTGPVLLELNAPLLAQPILEESDTETDTNTTTAEPSKPDTSSDTSKQSEATEETKTSDDDTSSTQTPKQPAPELPELSDQMKSLRAAIRQTIARYYAQPFNTSDNTPTDVLEVCMTFGCNAQIRRGSMSGQQLSAFTCLCWNYPCGGRNLLRVEDDQVLAQVGYGHQRYPSQFIAAMAMSRVPVEYALHIGEDVRAVSDLVEHEKSSCRSGGDNSFKLIGLARYVPTDATWKNDRGETWSIERLVGEELDRSPEAAPAGGTFRLLGLAYAIDRRTKQGKPLDGQFQQASDYLNTVTQCAFERQNSDGTWHPDFLARQGKAGTLVDQLRSTGHMLRWLAVSLPDDQLQDSHVVRGMTFLANALDTRRYRTYLHTTSSREIASRLGAVHALSLYAERLFTPYDEAEKAKQQEQEKAKKDAVAAAKPAQRS